jgi:uncharacterized membrane protein
MKNRWILLGLTSTIAVVCLTFFVIPYLVTQHTWCWSYNENTGVIGDTVGGIVGPTVGFIGVILTFLAFYIQYDANKVQRKALFMEQFESKFFELLRMHRENVDRINYDSDSGLIALNKLSVELQMSFERARKIDSNQSFEEEDLLKICFYFFYSGLTSETKKYIYKVMNQGEDLGKSKVLKLIVSDFDTWVKEGGGKKVITDQEVRLEIYFKHIFHMVSFLHRHEQLESDESTFFAETIMSQLSVHEIHMLIFYSLSEFGENWFKPVNYIEAYGIPTRIKSNLFGIEQEKLIEIIRNHAKSV